MKIMHDDFDTFVRRLIEMPKQPVSVAMRNVTGDSGRRR